MLKCTRFMYSLIFHNKYHAHCIYIVTSTLGDCNINRLITILLWQWQFQLQHWRFMQQVRKVFKLLQQKKQKSYLYFYYLPCKRFYYVSKYRFIESLYHMDLPNDLEFASQHYKDIARNFKLFLVTKVINLASGSFYLIDAV